MSEVPDHYTILELTKEATPEEIKAAYRRLAMKYHPDKNNSPEATVKFQQISEAYSTLSDPEKKQRYDLRGHPAFNISGFGPGFSVSGFGPGFSQGFDISDLFRGGNNSPRINPINLNLTYVDLIFGTTAHTIIKEKIHRNPDGSPASKTLCRSCQGKGGLLFMIGMSCSTCHGAGYTYASNVQIETRSTDYSVMVPPDSWPNRLIECNGKHFRCVPHQTPELRNNGLDLIVTQKLPLFSALLGFNKTISVAGRTHSISHPDIIQPNEIIRNSGEGLIGPNGQKGDLIISFVIEFPTKLNEKQFKYVKKCVHHGKSASNDGKSMSTDKK